MNPLAHNPFELADRAGLWLAAKIMAHAYRNHRVNPVVIRQLPRWAYVGSGITLIVLEPAKMMLTAGFVVIFGFMSYLRLMYDLPCIRADWNADRYREYSAKALAERDNFTTLRSASLVTFVTILFVFASPYVSEKLSISTASLCITMLLSVVALFWVEAAELPEPDDGDPYARPQSA
jgi:hypothetical protein